jgi:AcrR family transcriptional regulator
VTEGILQATMTLVADVGLEDLTLDAIAERAGVSRPTIYRRWTSKEALLEDAIELIAEEGLYPPDTGSIRDDLIFMARRFIDQMQGPMASLWTVYFDLEESQIAARAFRRVRYRNEEVVARAIARGDLRPVNARLLIESIFAIVWVRINVVHEMLDPAFAETVVDFVLDSWRIPPADCVSGSLVGKSNE